MKLGFIGTGAIAEAIVRGLRGPGGFQDEILLSERNRERSSCLMAAFSRIDVCADNQTLVDRSDWIVITVRPEKTKEVLSNLTFKPTQNVISVVAGMSLETLQPLVAPASRLSRIIPMPPIEKGICPIPVYPADDEVCDLFQCVGQPIPLNEERHFQVLAAGGSLMASYFELVATVSHWFEREAVPSREAALYATSLFGALSKQTAEVDFKCLKDMSEECLTPGGINEQVLLNLRRNGWFEMVQTMLDEIRDRLSGMQ